MSPSDRTPRGVESLIRAVAGGTTPEDRDQRASTFARGLALGALVGAAIAGSTLWQRRSALRREDPSAPRPLPSAVEPADEPGDAEATTPHT